MVLLALVLTASLSALLRPYVGVAVLLVTFPFLVGVNPMVGWQEQVFAGLFVGWVMGWGSRSFAGQQSRVRLPRVVAFPALLVGILLVFSAALGFLRGAPALDVVRDLSQFVGYLCIVPMCMVVRSRRQALWLLAGLLVVGAVSYIWNTAYWVSIKYRLPWPGWATLSVGASYIGPFIGALWVLPVLKVKPSTRVLAGTAIGLLVVLALVSGYRSRVLHVVALTCVGLLAAWISDRGRRSRVALAGLFLVTGVWVLVSGTLHGAFEIPGLGSPQRFLTSLMNPPALLADPSVQGRLVEAKAALSAFMRWPILGVGLGHRVEMKWAYQRWWDTAFTQHIWVTEMLMKFGIVGSALFMWFFVSIVRHALRMASIATSTAWKALALGVAVWIVVTLVPTVGHFGDRGFIFSLAIMLGILSVVCRSQVQPVVHAVERQM